MSISHLDMDFTSTEWLLWGYCICWSCTYIHILIMIYLLLTEIISICNCFIFALIVELEVGREYDYSYVVSGVKLNSQGAGLGWPGGVLPSQLSQGTASLAKPAYLRAYVYQYASIVRWCQDEWCQGGTWVGLPWYEYHWSVGLRIHIIQFRCQCRLVRDITLIHFVAPLIAYFIIVDIFWWNTGSFCF